MKIKPDYQKIIKEIAKIDNRIMFLIMKYIFTEGDLIKVFNDLTKPTAHIIAAIIMLKHKNENAIPYLKKVIEHNNRTNLDMYPTTMTIQEVEAKIHKREGRSEYSINNTYYMLLLTFFSQNIYHGETIDYIKKKCKEKISYFEQKNKNIDPKLLEVIRLHEKLQGSDYERMFNGMVMELEGADKLLDGRDSDELADRYLCEYDSENKVYNKVKRGIIHFFNYDIDDFLYMKSIADETLDYLMIEFDKFKKERWDLSVIRKGYFEDKNRIVQLRNAIKSLKKENKRLNDKVLKKIDKSSQKDLENKVHQLQKDNNYHLSRIEKMEEQIAILEEEKKLNAELEDNIIIEEKPEKKKTAKPEYQDIVILGGRWTSNNRKEVINFLPDNDIEFIEADKTLRNYDKIANSDIIFFDTSYNSHAYYYKVKKCNAEFYHINNSNLLEFEKIFGEEETGNRKQETGSRKQE